jgi:hypothetical protein
MSEQTEQRGSRWRHFLLMLPFFLIGVAIPVYFYGFSGDGPPQVTTMSEPSYSPAPPSATPDGYTAPGDRSYEQRPQRFGVVTFVRDMFERTVDSYVSPNLSPLTIKLGTLAVLFVAGFIVLRLVLALVSGALGSFFTFLVHKAAAPMFMGFLAVGSTWGIHQTIADQFGMAWAAATVSITAAIAALFALAGVRVRG